MNAKDVADTKRTFMNMLRDRIERHNVSQMEQAILLDINEFDVMVGEIADAVFSLYSVVPKRETDKYTYVDSIWEHDYPPLCPICNKPIQIGDSTTDDELGRVIHAGECVDEEVAGNDKFLDWLDSEINKLKKEIPKWHSSDGCGCAIELLITKPSNLVKIACYLRVREKYQEFTRSREEEQEQEEREDYDGYLNIQRAIKTGGSYHVD